MQMRNILKVAVCGWLCLTACNVSLGAKPKKRPPAPDPEVIRAHAKKCLEQIQSSDWARAWKGAEIAEAYLAKQKKGFGPKKKPVWYAKVVREGDSVGYLMWESAAPHRLLELGVDADPPFVADGKTCQAIPDVPNLQQFPVEGKTAAKVASGCAPTAAGNVMAYWVNHGFPSWQPETKVAGQPKGGDPETLTKRLIHALPMVEIDDQWGYTENKMALSGVYPDQFVEGIIADAKQYNVPLEVSEKPFSREQFEREIQAQRPTLLSCHVRLPHKPQLSWVHEVTGIGWTLIDGDFFVIVHDNFYPTKRASAARWIRADGLDCIVTIAPVKAASEKTPAKGE